MSKKYNHRSKKDKLVSFFGFGSDHKQKIKKNDQRSRVRPLRMEPLEDRHLLAITIEVLDNVGIEGLSNNNATAIVRTDTPTSSPETIYFSLEGTASSPTYSNMGTNPDYYLFNSSGTQLNETWVEVNGNYDYVYAIELPANASSATIELRPVNDSLRESTETAILTLCNDSNYTVDPDANTVTLSITDNDNWEISVSATDSSAAETAPVSSNYGTFTITRSGETDVSNALAVFFDMSGTASSNDYNLYDVNGNQISYSEHYDYNTGNYTYGYLVNISANSTSTTVELRASNDASMESTETAILGIAQNSGYGISSTAGTATIEIADNDSWTLSVTATDVTAAETLVSDPNYGTFTITRSGETDLSNSLTTYFTMSGTATGSSYMDMSSPDYYLYDSNGNQLSTSEVYNQDTGSYDYLYSVTIAANSLTAAIELRPVNDALKEAAETAVLTLQTDTNYSVDSNASSATATILASDQWLVSVAATDATAAETSDGSNTGTFTFTRSGETDLSNALTVWFSMSGTATLGNYDSNGDYRLYDASGNELYESDYYDYDQDTYYYGYYVTLASGVTSTTVELCPVNDAIMEQTETAVLQISSNNNYTVSATQGNATINIESNDNWIVSVAATDNEAAETSSSPNYGTYTITRSGETDTAHSLAVDFFMTGTASAGVDYQLYDANGNQISLNSSWDETLGEYRYTGIVTIPAHATTALIELRPINDVLQELTETAILNITSNSNYTLSNTNTTAQISVTDNDSWIVSVIATDAIAVETSDSSNTGTFTITRSGETDLSHSMTVWFSMSGTATLGNYDSNGDYRLYDASGNELYEQYQYDENTGESTYGYCVVIAAGSTTTTITVRPYNDAENEPVETVILSISSNVGYTVSSTSGNANINILSNDNWVVSVAATDNEAAETSSSPNYGTYTITRSGETDTAHSLAVDFFMTGTASAGVDYQLYDANGNQISLNSSWDETLGEYRYTGIVTIPAHATTALIQLRPYNDPLLESTEAAVLTLQPNTNYSVDSIASVAAVSIQPNDQWLVSVVATDPTAAETSDESNTGTFTFTRSGETDLSHSMTVWFSMSGTATLGNYDSNGDYRLYDASGNELYEQYQYDENTGESTYGYCVVIAAGTTTTTITLLPYNDSERESTETAVLTLSATNFYGTDPNSNSATIQMQDNDDWQISVIATDDQATELPSGSTDYGLYTFARSGQTSADNSLTVYFSMTGTANGSSYMNMSILDYNLYDSNGNQLSVSEVYNQNTGNYDYLYSVTFTANSFTTTVELRAVNDDILESAETAILTLQTDTNYSIDSNASSAATTILPSDQWTLSVTATDTISAETFDGSNTGTFTFTRSGETDLSNSMSVWFSMSGTATLGNYDSNGDYRLYDASGNELYEQYQYDENTGESTYGYCVVIAAGATTATITVAPYDDTEQESTETIILALLNSSSFSPGNNSSATINLQDNDSNSPWMVSITATDTAAETEPGQIANTGTFTFSRTDGLDFTQPLSINYTLSGTAQYGIDYESIEGVVTSTDPDLGTVTINGTIIIPANESSATLTIVPLNDTILELTETVILTLVRGEGYASLSTDNTAIVQISDNEPVPVITIESVQSAYEGGQDGYIRFCRNITTGPLTVYFQYDSINSTATGGIDYSFSQNTTSDLTGSVVFADGESTVDFLISAVDDIIPEETETLSIILLSDQVDANQPLRYTTGETTSASLSIFDREVLLTDSPSALDAEGTSFYTIQLEWTSVEYATGYILERSNNNGETWIIIDANLSTGFFIDMDLPVNSSYLYRVTAFNGYGNSSSSTTVVGSTIPLLAPANLMGIAGSINRIDLSWTASHEMVTHTIERSSDGDTWNSIADGIVGTSWSDTGLTIGQSWYYRIKSQVATGEYSLPSSSIAVYLPLVLADVPELQNVSATNTTTVFLEWTAEDGADSYLVERSTDNITWSTLASDLTTVQYTDTSSSNNLNLSDYYYRVSSVNAAGTSPASIAVQALPNAPQVVYVDAKTYDSIKLNWLGGAADLVYQLERSQDNGNSWTTLTNTLTDTTWTDTDLSPEVSYSYRLRIMTGTGAMSEPIILTITTHPMPPAVPTGLTVSPLSLTSLYLEWSAADRAESYTIQRSGDGVTWSTIANDLTDHSFTDTNLTADTTYYYRLSAKNGGGESEMSEPVQGLTPAKVPTEPIAPLAWSLGTDSVKVLWGNGVNTGRWTVQRSNNYGATWTTILAASELNELTDINLAEDTVYYYRVILSNRAGVSNPSWHAEARTAVSTLTAPTNLVVTPTGKNTMNVSWSTVANASLYILERSTDHSSWRIVSSSLSEESYADSGLVANTTYYYRVRAVNANNQVSPHSNTSSGLTDTNIPATPEGIALTVVSDTVIALSWKPQLDVTGWKIERSSDGNEWTVLNSHYSNCYYEDIGLTGFTGWFYRVSAVNRAGTSQASGNFYGRTKLTDDLYNPNHSFGLVGITNEQRTTSPNLGTLTGSVTLPNLVYAEAEDWFVFEMTETGGSLHNIELNWQSSDDCELALALYDESGTLVVNGVIENTTSTLSLNGISADRWFLRVYGIDPDNAENTTAGLENRQYTISIRPAVFVLNKEAPLVTAETNSVNSVVLSWEEQIGVLYYKVERLVGAETWTTLIDRLSATEYTDYSLEADTVYTWRVTAIYDEEDTYTSIPVVARTLCEDDFLQTNNSIADVNVHVVGLTTSSNIGTLTKPVSFTGLAIPRNDEDWFRFELTSQRTDAAVILEYDSLNSVAGQSDQLFFEVTNTSGTTLLSATLDENDNYTVSLDTLTAGVYYVRVYAPNNGQNADYDLSFVQGTPIIESTNNLTATLSSTGSVVLVWTENVSAEWYQVERTTDNPSDQYEEGQGPKWTIITRFLSDTEYEDTSITSATTYYYRVRGFLEDTFAGDGNTAFITTNNAVPDTPEQLKVHVAATDILSVVWSESPRAESYCIERLANNGVWTTLATVTDNYYIDSELTEAASYSYRVRAVNTLGSSEWSSVVTIEPEWPEITPLFKLGNRTLMICNNGSTLNDQLFTAEAVAWAADKTFEIINQPSNGTFTVNQQGEFSYTPATGYVGLDFIDFKVYDADDNLCDSASIVIKVYAPIVIENYETLQANNDVFTTINLASAGYNGSVSFDVLQNDNTVANTSTQIISVSLSDSDSGTVCVESGSRISYSPATNFTGTATINYTIQNSSGQTASAFAFVTVVVAPTNWQAGSLAPNTINPANYSGENSTISNPATLLTSRCLTGDQSFELTSSKPVYDESITNPDASTPSLGNETTISSVSVTSTGDSVCYMETYLFSYSYTIDGITYSGSSSSTFRFWQNPIGEMTVINTSISDGIFSTVINGEEVSTINATETYNLSLSNMYSYTSGIVHGGQRISTSSNSTQTNNSGYSINNDNVKMTGNSGQSLTSMGHSFQATVWTDIGLGLSLSGICGQGGFQLSKSDYRASGSWSQNDLNWDGGLAQNNSVSGTISSDGNQSSIQQYSTAGSLTNSGWLVSGSGSIRNSKTDASSMESTQGNYSQTSSDPNNPQTSSGSSSTSSSSSSTSSSTVYMSLAPGGNWIASSGTSDESQTSSSNSRSDWSGIYGSEEYAGITSGFSRQEQFSNKSVHMVLVNSEWEISGGTGREYGLTESESIYNSGRNADDPTQADSSYSHTHQETGFVGSGMGIAFANTTSTEYRRKYNKTDYTCNTSWGGSDWSIVGTGSIDSQTTVFSESSASNGSFNGPNGITGNNAEKYSKFYSDEGSSITTAYDPATQEWYTVSGSANSSQETTNRLSYSGSGSDFVISEEINNFFGDSTSQGSGMSRESSMSYFSEDNSSSNSTFSLVGDEWKTDTGSSYSNDGQYRSSSESSYEDSFGTEVSGVTWEQSGSNISDSGSSWSVEGTWSGTEWTETGNRIVRNKSENNELKSNSKKITGTMESAGATWNSNSVISFTSDIRQSTNNYFFESLGADGEWGLSASNDSQLTIYGSDMDDPDNPTSSGTRNSESYSLITSSSESSGTVVGGTYGSVCIISGSSSGTSSTRSEKSSSITEEVEEGLNGCYWTVSGTSGDSYSSLHTKDSSYTSVPVGSTGHSTTTYSLNDESSYSISMEISDYDTGWGYSEGTSDSSFSETTTVDTVLEVNMWSNVLSGKNVNWISKSGKLETEILQYGTSMTFGGPDMSNPTWSVNNGSEETNSGSWSITSAEYDEVSSNMHWNGGTATGTDGTVYNITSQSFREKIRNETGTSGITVSYTFDGEEWNSSGSTGAIESAKIVEYESSIEGTFAGGDFSRSSHKNTRFDYELVVGSNGDLYSSGTGTYIEDSGSSYSNNISGTMSGGTWSRSSSGSDLIDISAAFTAIIDQGNWTGWYTESGTASTSSESSEHASAYASHDLTTNDYYVYMDDSVQITGFSEEYVYDYNKEFSLTCMSDWTPGTINDPNNTGDWSLSSGTVSNDETTSENSYLNVDGTNSCGIGDTTLSGTVNWQTGSDFIDSQNWTKTYANGAWSADGDNLGSGFRENYTSYSYSVSGNYTSGSATGFFLLDTSNEYNSGESWKYRVATSSQDGTCNIVKSPNHTYTTFIYDYDYENSLLSTYATGDSESITKYSRHTVDCMEYEPDGSGNMVRVSPVTEFIGSGSYYSYNRTSYSRPYTRYIEENFTVAGIETGAVETEQDITFNIYRSAEDYRYYEVGTCIYSYLNTSGWHGTAIKTVSSTTGAEGTPNTNYSYNTYTNTADLSENTAYEYGYVTTTHFGYGLTVVESEGWIEGTSGFAYNFSNFSRSANGSSESNSGSYYDDSMECTYSSEYNKYDTSTNINQSNGHISADYSCSINWTYTSTPSPDGNKVSYTFSERYTGAGDRDHYSYSKLTGHEYIYSYFSISGGGTSYSEVNTRTTDTWTEQSSNTNDSFEYDYSWSWSYSTDGGFIRSEPVFENATEGDSTSSYQYYNRILYYNTYSGSTTELSDSPPSLSSDNFNEIIHYGGFNNHFSNYLDPEIARYTPFESTWSEHIYYSYQFYLDMGEEEEFGFDVQGVFWGNDEILYGRYMPSGPSLGVEYYQHGMPSLEEVGMPQIDSLLISFQDNPTAPVIQVEVDILAIIGTSINRSIDLYVQASEALVDMAVEIVDSYLADAAFVLNAAITVAGGIYDATIGSTVNNWMTVYNNMQATDNGFWTSVYAATGTILAEATGVLSIDNAIQGEDLYTGRQLSGTERFLEGVSGGIQLVSTAFGGLNAVRSTIRATGGCKTALGKMFTNCCFTADVEVLMSHKPITVSNEAVCVDKAEVHYFTDKNNYLPYIVTLVAGTLGVKAYISGQKRRNRNATAACYEMFGTEEENIFTDTNDSENEQFLCSLIESQWCEKHTPYIEADEMLELPEVVLENKLSKSKKHNSRKEKNNWHAKILQYGGLLTIIASLLMLLLLMQRDTGSNLNSSLPQAQAAVAPLTPSEPPTPEIYRKKISEIHIGERTIGTNPQGIEASESDSEIFQKVKHNGYTLLYLKENQTLSVIELLRPETWLESEYIQIRRGSDDKVLEGTELEQFDLAKEFNRDDEDYDLEVWIELPEMGVVGWATLVAIDDEVKIQEGPGNVVSGTFAHISDNVIDLQLEDQAKPIGCTGNHPFWSVDRQDFIEAGQLLNGEQVLLYSGETKRVVQKLPRPGPQVVYNLEVYSEHVYHVTQDGILVHNICNSRILGNNMIKAGISRASDTAAHHIVAATAKNAKEARKVLKRARIDINDACNGIFLDTKQHRHIHTTLYYETITNRLQKAAERKRSAKETLKSVIQNTLKEIAADIRNGTLFKKD